MADPCLSWNEQGDIPASAHICRRSREPRRPSAMSGLMKNVPGPNLRPKTFKLFSMSPRVGRWPAAMGSELEPADRRWSAHRHLHPPHCSVPSCSCPRATLVPNSPKPPPVTVPRSSTSFSSVSELFDGVASPRPRFGYFRSEFPHGIGSPVVGPPTRSFTGDPRCRVWRSCQAATSFHWKGPRATLAQQPACRPPAGSSRGRGDAGW